jgi:hypothetical protein
MAFYDFKSFGQVTLSSASMALHMMGVVAVAQGRVVVHYHHGKI